MKRLVIAVVSFLLLASFAAGAQADTLTTPVPLQSYKNSFYVSYGGLGLSEAAIVLGVAIISVPAAAIAGKGTDFDFRMSGNVQFGYARSVTKWLWVGGDFGYEYLDVLNEGSEGGNNSGLHWATLMASAKADWFRRENVAMYSKLSAGILGLVNLNEVSISPAFHVTVYGIEFGSPQVRGLVEIGAGFSATISAGLRYRF